MDAVSARDWIFARLTGAYIQPDVANEALDDYAHELAEKIRSFPESSIEPEYQEGYRDGRNDAAELIDPEKES